MLIKWMGIIFHPCTKKDADHFSSTHIMTYMHPNVWNNWGVCMDNSEETCQLVGPWKGGYVLENGLWTVWILPYVCPLGEPGVCSEQNGFGPAFLQRILRHNNTGTNTCCWLARWFGWFRWFAISNLLPFAVPLSVLWVRDGGKSFLKTWSWMWETS
jgi:hypothetical protein